MALRKPTPGQMLGIASVPFRDEEFASRYPSIVEYLFTAKWTDGSVRVTSTISLFADNDCLKLVLNDRDNNRSVFINATTVEGALVALEEALANDTADWKSRSGGAAAQSKTPW